MEEERHVGGVVDELRNRVGAPLGGRRESDMAGGGRQVGGHVRDVELGSSRLGRMNRFFRHDQELRFLVGEVELELHCRVRRTESLPKTSQQTTEKTKKKTVRFFLSNLKTCLFAEKTVENKTMRYVPRRCWGR